MTSILLNRESRIPEDGWFHVAPLGEHPIRLGNRKIVQVVDAAACEAMAAEFAARLAADPADALLVDYDHFSESLSNSSEAAGWIRELQDRPDGLWARIEWSDRGQEAVLGKRYRFLSPVWNRVDCQDLGGNRLRPLRLDRAAVTNDPNIRGLSPLTNRSPGEPAPADPADHESPVGGGKESIMDYKAELLALLGLPAEASDEDIAGACAAKKEALANAATAAAEREALVNRAQTAEAEVARRDRQLLEAAVESDLEQFKDRIANRDQVREQLLANRAGTLATLMALKPAAEGEPRRDGGTPPALETDEQKLLNRKLAREAFVGEVQRSHRCSSRAQAWEIAQHEKPELFT